MAFSLVVTEREVNWYPKTLEVDREGCSGNLVGEGGRVKFEAEFPLVDKGAFAGKDGMLPRAETTHRGNR